MSLFGGFGQSSKKAARRLDPRVAQDEDMDVPRPPQQRAINLPPPPTVAESGWIEDDVPGSDYVTGYTMNAQGDGFEREWQQPRLKMFGGMARPMPAPQQPPAQESHGMGAMDIIGNPATQGRMGNLLNSNLMQYAMAQNRQMQLAEDARKRANWTGVVRNLGGPLLGLFGLSPEGAYEGLDAQYAADRKLSQGADPSSYLRDADMLLKLAQGSDPDSYKNQKMQADIDLQRQKGQSLEGKLKLAQQQLELKAILGNRGLDIKERAQIAKQAHDEGILDLKTIHETLYGQNVESQIESRNRRDTAYENLTDSNIKKNAAMTEKIGADINNNYQKLQQGNEKLEIMRQRFALAAQKATDANSKWQYEQAAKQLYNQQRLNIQKYNADTRAQLKAHQVNSKGEEVYPGFEKYLQQLEDADLVSPQPSYTDSLPALPAFSGQAPPVAPRQVQSTGQMTRRLQQPAAQKAPQAAAPKQAAQPAKPASGKGSMGQDYSKMSREDLLKAAKRKQRMLQGG